VTDRPVRIAHRGPLSRGTGTDPLPEGPPPLPAYFDPVTPLHRLTADALRRDGWLPPTADPPAAADPDPPRPRPTVRVVGTERLRPPDDEQDAGRKLARELRARGVPSARWSAGALQVDDDDRPRAAAVLRQLAEQDRQG
jgi:hypothetical protein